MEEQSHLKDREDGLQLRQLQRQPDGQADPPPLGLRAHRGKHQQKREEVQEIITRLNLNTSE